MDESEMLRNVMETIGKILYARERNSGKMNKQTPAENKDPECCAECGKAMGECECEQE